VAESFSELTPLADSALAGIYLQRDGVLHFVNEHLASMLGRPVSQLIGADWLQFVFEEDRERVSSFAMRASDGRAAQPVECRIYGSEGVRWVVACGQPVELHGASGLSGAFTAGYVVDITDHKLVEERLHNALSLHAATIESTTDGIVVLNRAREIVSHNRRFAEIWHLEDILDKDPEVVRLAMGKQMVNLEAFREVLARTLADPTIEEMVRVELVDGRHMEVYSKPCIVEGEVIGRVWSWRDVTDRRRFESALIRLANHDSLTGLMNRRKIQEELECCLAHGAEARGALLLLDLDGFKEINDTFGHQAGDEVLLQVARVLSDADLGELIGRFGGDEFAMLLPGVTPPQAIQAAERTLHLLADHDFSAAGTNVSLTGSMGVALYPSHATTSDDLLSAADLALYEAKSNDGGNIHVYSQKLRYRSLLQRRGDWQTQLRNAISRGRGRLYAEKTASLQDDSPPIYRLTIRMTGSRSQVLSSRDLGGLGHQAGLSVALDRWLLRETIALAQRPSFVSTPAGLSFEISAHSLTHPDVMLRLLDLSALRAAQDCPLIIELTDFEALSGLESSIATLRAACYRFKVTESSGRALAQMMSLMPVDYLKLDSWLVRRLNTEPGLRPLVEGALFTADRLAAHTIAEGVPDQPTLNVLRNLGVDYARGAAVAAARSASAVFKANLRSQAA
jgi:diguanylate cyclase (GGDEF)-like protein/PAS domain S-box-containing protein